MANITILDPSSGNTKTISATMEASIILQDLLGDIEFFITLSTTAKDVAGNGIPKYTIKSLQDGAGGTGLDRHELPLASGKYANLTDAINDYIAMMVNGVNGQPTTEMSFS